MLLNTKHAWIQIPQKVVLSTSVASITLPVELFCLIVNFIIFETWPIILKLNSCKLTCHERGILSRENQVKEMFHDTKVYSNLFSLLSILEIFKLI